MIGVGVLLSGGPRSAALPWMLVPVVGATSVFGTRGVVVVVFAAVATALAATVPASPQEFASAPTYVAATIILIVAVGLYVHALMAVEVNLRHDRVLDPLTGLLNRTTLERRFGELRAQAVVAREPVAMLLIDLDHFKRINDTGGHDAGDAVLREVAYELRRSLRAFEAAYRLGGEEFLVLLPGLDEPRRSSTPSACAGGSRPPGPAASRSPPRSGSAPARETSSCTSGCSSWPTGASTRPSTPAATASSPRRSQLRLRSAWPADGGPRSRGSPYWPRVFTPNVPNLLTLLRILLVPVLVVALLGAFGDTSDLLAAIVFAFASFTDAIDGYIARSREQITTFGKLMDPVADKLLVIAALLALVSLGRLEAWVAMVIIAREFAVTVARMAARSEGVVIPANWWGKAKTAVQVLTIFLLILIDPSPAWVDGLVYVMVAITVISGVDYFFGMRRLLREAEARRAPVRRREAR